MSDDAGNLLAMLPSIAFAGTLLLARVSAAVTVLPGLGEAAFPPIVRAGMALAVTAVLLPTVAPLMPAVPDVSLAAAGMIGAEAVTGLCLGWLARLVCLALPIAGQLVSYLLGLATVLQPDIELGAQTTAISRLFELAVPVILLTSGLYALPLTALAGSYRLIPAGTLLPAADSTAMAVSAVAQAFALALRLAAPFLLAAIVWHLAIGLMARLVPRLQIYFVALPGQIAGGLLLLAVLIAAMLMAWQEAARDALVALPGN